LPRIRVAPLGLLIAVLFAAACAIAQPAWAQSQPRQAAPAAARLPAGAIADIKIEGNQRVEAGTILSYMTVQVGDQFDPDRLDRSLKTLYATGLFSDVKLSRSGNTLVVKVAENPIVNRIAFEGNSKLNDDKLRPLLQLRPRAVFTPALAEADRQHILEAYAHDGRYAARVEPKIIKLGENRVDVVFEITEGNTTLVSRIAFVGNKAFSEGRLREVVDSREERWWRFLSSSDEYEPQRVEYDKELLRRFYLKNGYADINITNATAELAPDRSAFFLTFTVDEGERYKVSKVSVHSTLRHVDGKSLEPIIDISAGDWYDGDAVERNVQALTDAVQHQGIAFVDVKPGVKRDPKAHTIEIVFEVDEGPRVYVERMDITGNTRTQDSVIRRELRLADGDAFNGALLRRSKQVLSDLNYFNSVNITDQPGSAPDRKIVTTNVDEKATGELTIGGGYSTDVGALLNIGLHERNFVGTGIDAGVQAVIAQLQTQASVSVTDPYFLGRNIVAGTDVFYINNNLQTVSLYDQRRYGLTLRSGYSFSDHLRQFWNYSAVNRDVYNVASNASPYITEMEGTTTLSQISQTLSVDYRDSTLDPHSGWVFRLGTDLAGLGGTEHFIRAKGDVAYYLPLDRITGNEGWDVAITGGLGYLYDYTGQEESIVDRFFLGGDNLRGFLDGGAGPHVVPTATYGASATGGRYIWTQSTELRFPLPLSADIGLTGRVFADIGALTLVNQIPGVALYDNPAPRVGTGFGISWKTPLGLINLDIGIPVVKYQYDQTQIFRIGFGTRF
jgi:outer membrane protein insertion porin family